MGRIERIPMESGNAYEFEEDPTSMYGLRLRSVTGEHIERTPKGELLEAEAEAKRRLGITRK